MVSEFELNHLKYFYFTVLEGGVEPAARRLCVQQPVVSKMLSSLEERFGQQLFRKSGRRKVLTDYGQLVYRHCQTVFLEIEKLNDLKQGTKTLSGPLSFGCAEVIAGEHLSDVLQSLANSHPELHPNIYTSTARHLIEMISQRKLAFGFFFHLPELPPNLEIYRRVPLRFHLVVSRKLRSKTEVIERFIGSREIDDTSTHRFPTLERLRRDHGKARIVLSSNHLNLHRNLVRRGYGSAILPCYLVQADLKAKVLWDLYPKEKFNFDLKVVTAKGEVLPKAAQEIIDLFMVRIQSDF